MVPESRMLPDSYDRHLLLRAAAAMLPGETPRLDAELLLAAAMGEERLSMLASRAPAGRAACAKFAVMLARRMRHEPVAHILGQREFWSLPLRVTPDVLVPRPDSETLIEAAVAHFERRLPASVLDLGTGSGALLLAALAQWPGARGIGVDRSVAALEVARDNAVRLGMGERARFVEGDWAGGLSERFDLVLCNPPYVPEGTALMPDVALFEPHEALFGGVDGLDPYRLLIPEMPRLLASAGVALFEFGEGQADSLLELAASSGFAGAILPDLGGRPRVLQLRAG